MLTDKEISMFRKSIIKTVEEKNIMLSNTEIAMFDTTIVKKLLKRGWSYKNKIFDERGVSRKDGGGMSFEEVWTKGGTSFYIDYNLTYHTCEIISYQSMSYTDFKLLYKRVEEVRAWLRELKKKEEDK